MSERDADQLAADVRAALADLPEGRTILNVPPGFCVCEERCDELRQVEAALATTRQALAQIQWSGYSVIGRSPCPGCSQERTEGHREDCFVARALAVAGGDAEPGPCDCRANDWTEGDNGVVRCVQCGGYAGEPGTSIGLTEVAGGDTAPLDPDDVTEEEMERALAEEREWAGGDTKEPA